MALVQTLRRSMLATLFALLATTVAHAAPPPEIAATAVLFPENTKGVVACHLTPEVREWMFSSFFFNPAIYRKVLTEQADKFAKATGFNPLEDIEWDVIAFSDNPQAVVLVLIPKKDPTKVLETLMKDSKSAALFKTEVIKGVTVVRIDQIEIAVTPKLVALAPTGALKPILERAGESPSNARFIEQIASSAMTSAQCYGLAAPSPETMAAIAQNPNVTKFGGAVLGRVKQVAVWLDFKELGLVLRLDSKDAAIVAGDQLKGLITSAKGLLSPATVKPPVPEEASPLEHINPKVILARVTALSGVDALNAITVTAEGEAARITIPKDKVPLMRAEGSTLFVAAAAVAGGAYGALQAKGGFPGMPGAGGTGDADEKAQCHAIQQRLSAAVELYNTDKKKKNKLEEIADQLVQSQYLESKPDDPGQAPGSFTNFFTAPDGRVSCKIHGSPEAGEPADSERATPERTSGSPAASPSPAPQGEEEDGDQ